MNVSAAKDIKSREIRVFLSSTFRDMEEERNYLMAYVFPDIRRECNARQVAFTEIDLRWGITEQASKQGRTVEICLEEIDRCREHPPFFIGFIGERYGWVPQQQDIESWLASSDNSSCAEDIHNALKQGISVTELEMQYAFLNTNQPAERSRVFLRAPSETERVYQQAIIDSSADKPILKDDFYDSGNGKLAILKDTLRQSDCLSIDGYTSIKQFGESVKEFLLEAVDRLYPADELSDADLQTRAHHSYAQSRRKAYVPLTEIRAKVMADIDAASTTSDAVRHIAITGLSGRGKSSFLADLDVQLATQGHVFTHYTGSDGNRSIDAWLSRLLDGLQNTGKLISERPENINAQWQAVSIALLEAQEGLKRPIYILVDAVNQFTVDKPLNKLSAIQLPEGVVLVAATTEDEAAEGWLAHTLPAFTVKQIRHAIQSFFSGYRKELSAELVEQITNHPASAEPLFLRLLLEELRMHASHETLDSSAGRLLAEGNAGALFASVVAKMDSVFNDNTDDMLASNAIRLLGASLRGLRYDDLARLLATDADAKDPSDPKGELNRLPDMILSPLLGQLESFFLSDNGRFYLMHDALLEVALQDTERLEKSRQQLAEYFNSNEGRAIAERVYQYRAMGKAKELIEHICHLENTLLLLQAEPTLLRSVLSEFGVNSSTHQAYLDKVTFAWQHTINEAASLPEGTEQFAIWLMNNAYETLAECLFVALLQWHKKQSPIIALAVAKCLNNLAGIYLKVKKDAARAESLYQEAIDIWRANLLESEPSLAVGLHNLAAVLQNQNRLEEAEKYFKEALSIKQKIFIDNQASIASTLNSLADLYRIQTSRVDEALPLYEQALQLYRACLNERHPDIAAVLNNLGLLYYQQGELDQARDRLEQALEILKASRPKFHPDTAACLHSLAVVYEAQGDLSKAQEFYDNALQMNMRVLPAGDVKIALGWISRADLFSQHDMETIAMDFYVRAVEVLQIDTPSLQHLLAAKCFNCIAELALKANDLKAAEHHFKLALDIRRELLHEMHSDIAVSLKGLAETYCAQGQIDAAVPLLEQALVIMQAQPVGSEAKLAVCLKNLAAKLGRSI